MLAEVRSDGGVLSSSIVGRALLDQPLCLPPTPPVHHNLIYLVGGKALPLRNSMIWPYPRRNLPEHQAVFIYCLSRACRVIENRFGILAARWHISVDPSYIAD